MNKLFTEKSQAIFWNNNTKAIQRMLDYDFICKRKTPSVAAIVHPTSSASFQKFFFGDQEIMIPIYKSTTEAAKNQPTADIFLNFASFRTAAEVSLEATLIKSIRVIMITAEGIPERDTREINMKAKESGKILIGPSTVGAISPGVFKTANIGGTIEQIVKSKMHVSGSAGLVTRSGGLFNEIANTIALNADGIAEGVAIGGDRFPGSGYLDHLLRMEKNNEVKYFILLGEVGGKAEYEVIEAYEKGELTKPIVAWCIGTVVKHFNTTVQFGHAGASANTSIERAGTKNNAMKKAGFIVPRSFNDLHLRIKDLYKKLAGEGIVKAVEPTEYVIPKLPQDFSSAKKEGVIRKETNFICTISDDRGDEAHYAGHPISSVATPETGFTIADVISLLWFKKRYPKWATDFIETVIKTAADHGPAVSGAHNARVSARAGKDLVSCLCSGLLTIGPKFGGAIDGAAKYIKKAYDDKLEPKEFVSQMKQKGLAIPGIGHKIKSIKNPDLRVKGLKEFAIKHFPNTNLLDYALEVEKITSAKKDNLILNVDGTIGVLMVDMWKSLNYSDEEIDQFIECGTLNAFFVLSRTIGFIGHVLDEKRLNMPLYRHQFDDILYDVPTAELI
ncbi:ATP citrate synthase [Candidatus Marinamargulisbacteria bacterium SCGC AAA071-K20]|nr:ATP citrate synthase [Candidatus Marinamargulisbacteria bacterium SCGC AAA071-K20]